MTKDNLQIDLLSEEDLQAIRGGFATKMIQHAFIEKGVNNCCNQSGPILLKQREPNDTIQPKGPSNPPMN